MNNEQNSVVINLVQAMLGSVTPNWRAVFVKGDSRSVLVTFVLATESREDREQIEDVTFEFEALQPDNDVAITVLVSGVPIETFADAGRMVFARKE